MSAQRTASSDRPSIVTPKHIAERVLRDRDAMQGERKAVTVLFADIKGSTGLIQHEDPEEAGLILQTVLRSMIEAVHRFDEAHAHASAAISASRDSEQPLPILLAHLGRGLVHLREERFADAAAWLEPTLSFSHKPSLRGWWGALGSPLGRAWLGLGRVSEAMSLLEKVVAHSASPRGSGHVLRSIHLAEAYLAAERIPAAATLANEAHALARAHGERGHEAYALLLLAELARAGGQIDEAINYAHEARQLCAELQMQPLVRRVTKSLAEWEAHGFSAVEKGSAERPPHADPMESGAIRQEGVSIAKMR